MYRPALSAYVLKDFGLLQFKFKQINASVLAPVGGSNWLWEKGQLWELWWSFITFILKNYLYEFKRIAQQSKCLSAKWESSEGKASFWDYNQTSSYELNLQECGKDFCSAVVLLTVEIIWLLDRAWFCIGGG